MGGYGSGRWGRRVTKGTTDAALRLDVRWLARQGYLTPASFGTYLIVWSLGERRTGTILVRYDANRPDELRLIYHTRRHESEPWAQVREAVPLDRTPCRYGGERIWFQCPGCVSRRAVLFSLGGRFRCRACHDLAYSSTREDVIGRHRRRADELRHQLGGEPGPFSLPWKPKGMHWQTYDRMMAEMQAREVAASAGLGAKTDALIERFDRHYGSLLSDLNCRADTSMAVRAANRRADRTVG